MSSFPLVRQVSILFLALAFSVQGLSAPLCSTAFSPTSNSDEVLSVFFDRLDAYETIAQKRTHFLKSTTRSIPWGNQKVKTARQAEHLVDWFLSPAGQKAVGQMTISESEKSFLIGQLGHLTHVFFADGVAIARSMPARGRTVIYGLQAASFRPMLKDESHERTVEVYPLQDVFLSHEKYDHVVIYDSRYEAASAVERLRLLGAATLLQANLKRAVTIVVPEAGLHQKSRRESLVREADFIVDSVDGKITVYELILLLKMNFDRIT